LTSIRDSEELAKLFDEQDEAVKWTIESVIREARKASAKVGLSGQDPRDKSQTCRVPCRVWHLFHVRKP
jgi:phosphoenolpyruvate synthase/pyruvate phosphate dikinase